MSPIRPHVLGIDDGPFEKRTDRDVVVVGVVMEGNDLVEGVATTRFAVDGEDVTTFLAAWIGGLRFRPALQAVVLGGITLAGLAIVDVRALAAATSLPVLVVNRRAPSNRELEAALRAAGLAARLPLLASTPASFAVNEHLHAACAGIARSEAESLLGAIRRKGELPEPLRLAHLIARAVTTGESRGRA